eukprot:gene34430-40338_t
MIAQLSSNTINGGVLLLRISPGGDKLVRQWIQNHVHFRSLQR